MKTVLTILICLGLLGGAVFAVKTLAFFKPEAKKVEKERVLSAVETLTAKPIDVALRIPTQGLVEPARTSSLASEVAGKVTRVSPKFEVGGRFKAGEVLLELDPADYQAAVTQAQANLADAKAALAQEQARADQAIRDWKKISPGTQPNALAAREPQLASATARAAAAADAVTKAERDLARTTLKAPFDGRIKSTNTQLGSYVTPGSLVATLDSTESHEVRLPLSLDDYAFIKEKSQDDAAEVEFTSKVGGRTYTWKGHIIRLEGEVDRSSRSVRIVAKVDAPTDDPLLQSGLFLKAKVEGRTLKNVFRIPRSAFLDEDTILVVKPDNRITFRDLSVLRPDGTDLLVESGLKEGEQVCLTTLAAPIEDMEVTVLKPGPTATSAP